MRQNSEPAKAEATLTAARILETAEEVLRRFGPDKATVVDVARALGVSHGSVYRHFASKADLRAAVVQRWLDASLAPLESIASGNGSATKRLRAWLDQLVAIKRQRAAADPELFAAYFALAREADAVVRQHMDELRAQVVGIVADGVAQGELTSDDYDRSAQSILDATVKFQNPAHAASWKDPNIDTAYDAVWQLILRGLAAKP